MSLSLFSSGNAFNQFTDDSKTIRVPTGSRETFISTCTAAACSKVVPTPTSCYPMCASLRALRIFQWRVAEIHGTVPISTPFPDVSVHVIQAKRIGKVGPDNRGTVQVRALEDRWISSLSYFIWVKIGMVTVKISLFGRELVSKGEGTAGSCSTGIFLSLIHI